MSNEPNEPRVCLDVVLPDSGLELAMTNMWANGTRLRVHFLGGSSFLHGKVKEYARKWEPYANISFNFVDDPTAEIRVDFRMDGTSWSAVGADALNTTFFPPGSATMNYGWLTKNTDEQEFSRVIVHEFGHALGCIHEHQNPAGGIPWNKDAVYNYFMGPPNNWTKEQVDHNLFETYDANLTNFTALDKSSIMMYPIDPSFTTNGFSVGLNQGLSETDKKFIAQQYP